MHASRRTRALAIENHARRLRDFRRSSHKRMNPHWDTFFDTSTKEEGASSELIADFLRTALQSLSAEEVANLVSSQ